MFTGLDTNRDVRPYADWAKSQGFTVIMRYYTALASAKMLTRAEALGLSAKGFRLGAVYQDRGRLASDFSAAHGTAAGKRALDYAMGTIGQPRGSGIYFSVDFDASQKEIDQHILPHFQSIRAAMIEHGESEPSYRLGAYGSGLVLKSLLDEGVIELAWLSMSMGFRGSKAFYKAGHWNLHQKLEIQNAPTPAGPFSYDPNEISASGCGDFSLELADSADLSIATTGGLRYRVNARSGLWLRKGPGTKFGKILSLAAGTHVNVLGRAGDWALIDLEGDGLSDGYSHAGFLSLVD